MNFVLNTILIISLSFLMNSSSITNTTSSSLGEAFHDSLTSISSSSEPAQRHYMSYAVSSARNEEATEDDSKGRALVDKFSSYDTSNYLLLHKKAVHKSLMQKADSYFLYQSIFINIKTVVFQT